MNRYIKIFTLDDQDWKQSYTKIVEAELNILDKLDRSDYPVINDQEDLTFDDNGNIIYMSTNLPVETNDIIDKDLNKFKDNLFYLHILYYRNMTNNITLRIKESQVGNYGDVLSINESFLKNQYSDLYSFGNIDYNINLYCLVVTDDNGLYYGSVWIFTHPDYPYIGMYGIKRSILDHITKSKLEQFKGISRILINKIVEFGKEYNKIKLLVINPLETMVPILKKYRFTEVINDDENTDERKFINYISGAHRYFTKII